MLGQFVEYIARSGLLAEAPPVFVAFVDMLTAVASGPKGARVRHICLTGPFNILLLLLLVTTLNI